MAQIELTSKDIKFAERYAFKLCALWGAYCGSEIRAAAREGLGVAAVFFDPARKIPFRVFAKFQIKKSIIQYYRDNFGKSGIIKDLEFVQFDENRIERNGLESRIIAKDLLNKFYSMSDGRRMYRLSEKAIRRISLKYKHGFSHRELVGIEKISEVSVSRFFKKIRNRANIFLGIHT